MNRIVKELESTFRFVTSEGHEFLTCDEVLVFKHGYFPLVFTVVIHVDLDTFVVRIIGIGFVLDEGPSFHVNVVIFLLNTSYQCKKYQY